MWSTLALLLLFGAVIGTSAGPCTLYQLPDTGSCEITIDWKVNDHKHALATCLEYFPTTFVTGTRDKATGKAHCVVTAAYSCAHLEKNPRHPDDEVFLMYDKCYIFSKKNGKYVKGTIDNYKTNNLCNDGKLSVFYSHTHAKFVGMKANKLDIEKLWIGINSDGTLIEDPKKMMHKNLWKLVEGDYWADDKLIKLKAEKDGKYKYPPVAKYFFMRTRTDYVMNRIQGSFERTTDAMEATFACEFESKFTAEQEWYCNKLPMLGIDAVYDKDELKPVDDRKPRCLYVTANSYTFTGDKDKIKATMDTIKGCQEKPSDLHSAGMDDGTASPASYVTLKNKGTLRIATVIVDKVTAGDTENKNGAVVQNKCQSPVTDLTTRRLLFQKWRHFDHFGKMQFSAASQIPWDDKYPKNECSDFPGKSSNIGLKNGKKIDMPPEVRAQAVCSLKFFQECENRSPCDAKYECNNVKKFMPNVDDPKLAGFFTCTCPGEGEAHKKQDDGSCKWIANDAWCAWFHFSDGTKGGHKKNLNDDITAVYSTKNDKLDKVVVRAGCKITVRSHEYWYHPNLELLSKVGYGTHHVANTGDGTLAGEWYGMGATSAQCWC